MRRVLISLLLLATSVGAQDFRILIDISGSMVQNDPQNLRRPALELLIESLPNGSEAGVWTFGQYVNMLVKHGEVNRQWRRDARAKVDDIVSIAQRTNIGDAMTTAAFDLDVSGNAEPVTYLLLTDGFVDISQNQARNYAERNRILQQLLPRLRDGNAVMHTIALSEGADMQLLDFLALRTNGVSTKVASADDLPRVFADLLGVAVASEQIPLTDQQSFKIDDQVNEVTALMFIQSMANLSLQSPNGELIDQMTQRSDVRWYSDDRYALVTISEPIAGMWQVAGDLQPGSRVNVISDLSLQVQPAQTNLVIGESLSVMASLVSDMQIPEQILAQTTVSASISEPGQMPAQTVFLNRQANQYSGMFASLPGGSWRLDITAESDTFSRRRSFLLTVRQPFSAEIVRQGSTANATLRANDERLMVSQALLELDSGQVLALQKEMDSWAVPVTSGQSAQFVVTYQQDGQLQQWRSGVFSLMGDTMMATMVTPIVATPQMMAEEMMSTPVQEPMMEATSEPEMMSEPTPESEMMSEPTAEPMEEAPMPTEEVDMWAVAEEETSSSWIAFAIAGGVGVLVLGAAFYLFKRYEARMKEEESIELSDEDDEAPVVPQIDITLDDVDLDETPTEEAQTQPSKSLDDELADLGQPEDLPDDLDSLQNELDKLSGEIGDPSEEIEDIAVEPTADNEIDADLDAELGDLPADDEFSVNDDLAGDLASESLEDMAGDLTNDDLDALPTDDELDIDDSLFDSEDDKPV